LSAAEKTGVAVTNLGRIHVNAPMHSNAQH